MEQHLTIPGIPIWNPIEVSPAEFPEITALTKTLYRYNQEGLPERFIRFLENGVVSSPEGVAIGHVFWNLELNEGSPQLSIKSDNASVCRMGYTGNNIWRGYWELNGRMPVEVVPVATPGNTGPINNVRRSAGPEIIHVRLSGQLGNCLRNIASVKILADSTGAEWDIDLDQIEGLPRTVVIIKALFPDRIRVYPPDSYIYFGEHKIMEFLHFCGTNYHPLVEAMVNAVPSFDFGIRHIYAFRPVSMTDADYVRRKFSFYKNVLWPSQLLEDVRQFISNEANGSLSEYVGCHIRYTDNLSDPCKRKFNLNTSLATFIDRLAMLKGQPILLCTDNQALKATITSALPDARILFPNICTNNPDIWQPLYEMHLLSHTKYVIGSLSSTFSYEACLFHGTDLELFEDGEWNMYEISKYR